MTVLSTTLCFYPIDKMRVTIHNKSMAKLTNAKKSEYKAGHVFGMLTLLADQTQGQKHKLPFKCICDVEKDIALHSIVSGAQKSCGCLRPKAKQKEPKREIKILESGSIFGGYILQETCHYHALKSATFICIHCNEKKIRAIRQVVNRPPKSCGCMYKKQRLIKGMEFSSVLGAAQHFGVHKRTIFLWIKNGLT
jgi:hypothetical protein